jgi:hypothetical protein
MELGIGIHCLSTLNYPLPLQRVRLIVSRHFGAVRVSLGGGLHDDTPAGLVAAAAVARLSALWGGRGLDDGGDGGGNAGRHDCDVVGCEACSGEVNELMSQQDIDGPLLVVCKSGVDVKLEELVVKVAG